MVNCQVKATGKDPVNSRKHELVNIDKNIGFLVF